MATRQRWIAQVGPVRSLLVALLRGLATGWALVALYALAVAQLWPHGPVATYWAGTLVLSTALVTAGVTSLALRRGAAVPRLARLFTVFITASLSLAPAAVVRLIPPVELGGWLSRLVTFDVPWSASFAELDVARTPMLGDRLVEGEVWIALAVELVVIMALVYVVAQWSTRGALCSSCHHPCELTKGVYRYRSQNPGEVRQRLERRDWDYFRQAPESPGRGRLLRFDIVTCPACAATNQLTVMLERAGRRDAPLVKNLALSRDDVRTVQSLV